MLRIFQLLYLFFILFTIFSSTYSAFCAVVYTVQVVAIRIIYIQNPLKKKCKKSSLRNEQDTTPHQIQEDWFGLVFSGVFRFKKDDD